MSNVKELTDEQALEALRKWGNKCYRKGYYRAGLEIYGSLAAVGLLWFVCRYLDKKGTKKEPEIKTYPEEEAE